MAANVRELLRVEARAEYRQQPQADSRRYMTLLLHDLAHLQRLPSARAALLKRLRPELRAIVDAETAQLKLERVSALSAPTNSSLQTESNTNSGGGSGGGGGVGSGQTPYQAKASSWARNTLVELMERVFRVFTRVLANHMLVCSALQELEVNADAAPTATTGSSEEPSYTVERVWTDMQLETWTMLLGYLQSRTPSLTGLSLPPSTVAVAASDFDKENLRLTFSFTNSNVASVTRMSRDGSLESDGTDELELADELASMSGSRRRWSS